MRELQVLLGLEPLFLALLGGVCGVGGRWGRNFLGEYVLYREDLVEELELLLRDLLV